MPRGAPITTLVRQSDTGCLGTDNFAKYLTVRSGTPVVVLFSTGRLVHSFHHGRLVEQDDPRLAVLRVPGIVKVAEVDISDTLVRLVHHTNTDITVLFVLTVQGIPHHIVRGLWMKARNAEHLVTSPIGRSSTSTSRPTRGSKRPSWRASSSVTHDHSLVVVGLWGGFGHLLQVKPYYRSCHKKSPDHVPPMKRSSSEVLHFTVLNCCVVMDGWCHRSK